MKFTLLDYESHIFLKLDQNPDQGISYECILDSIVKNGDLGRADASEVLLSVLRRLIYRGKVSVPREVESLMLFSKNESDSNSLENVIIRHR